ncbi:Fe2+-dependent dioxygenase [Microcoleus sp. herbarium19]|uniref:Fe2+-dependent dioxygenase n=1 Tax=unclassified Microcoleus TaxID=2642155 RepID=UPI002FCE86EC
MILCIADVLTAQELDAINSALHSAKFVDGKTTAGWHARLVKQNTQLQDDGSAPVQNLKTLVSQALQRNSLFQMAVLPKKIRPALFSRYQKAMSYGSHVDNAVMGQSELMRSDVSLTLFLSQPESYDGGELVIESSQGEQGYKLPAGSMIVYPSTTLHRVEAVTAGSRLAAVTWVQSLVRDSAQREILFDLETARQILFEKSGKTSEFDLISKSYANLLRQWASI